MKHLHPILPLIILLLQAILMSCSADKINDTHAMKNFSAYNLWANEQFAQWLGDLDEALISQEVVSSFSSIRATIFHLWHAEHGWMQALQEKDWKQPNNSDEGMSNEMLISSFLNNSKELDRFVQGLNDNALTKSVELSSGNKEKRDAILLHVFNHSTFHRGQIITMARNLGVKDLPRTDYIFYLKMKK
jgi:uncharacterized damage-inducible protein DinB